jgi:hypothetical protein
VIDPRARILLLVFGLAVLVLVVNLVRKRQLQERYALLWLLAGLVLVLAPLFVDGIDRLAAWLGFEYPPALLLMLAVVGLMLIIAQLSLAISGQADRIKILTQELGLLRAELADMKARVENLAGQDGSPADPVDLSERQRTGRPEQR